MKQTFALAALLGVAFSFQISSDLFGQGPLAPPGAPAPTMKTLDQIEPRTPISSLPFTISQPGSYYLTASLQFSATSGNAITIASGDVTLDLMGHILSSTAGVTGNAININASMRNIAVVNGTIAGNTTVTGDAASEAGLTISLAGFSSGINSAAIEATGNRFSNLTITGCRVIGLDAGTQALVEHVTVSQNGAEGIDAVSGVVTHCTALLNGSSGGIVTNGGGTISNCTSNSNNGPGFGANGSTLINCSATTNRTFGIDASNGSVINCVATSNRDTGIQVDGGTAANSTAVSNQGVGIDATNGSVSNCLARNNVGTNILAPELIDHLPFTITQSGSYYLSRNLQFTAASGHAITITVSEVTLDLRGHTLSSTAAVTGDGIRINASLRNVTVTNGIVTGATGVAIVGSNPINLSTTPGGFANGINAVSGPQSVGLRFSHLSISGCRTIGLNAGLGPVVEHVTASLNGGVGIDTEDGSVSHCAAYLNAGTGIRADFSSIINCTATNNDSFGISVSQGTVTNCRVSLNSGRGISANDASVTNCTARNNGDDGIFAFNGVVAFCLADGNNLNANGSLDIDATAATRTGNNPTP